MLLLHLAQKGKDSMKTIKVKVNNTVVLEYNLELFQEHIGEITVRAMNEAGAFYASSDEIVLRNFSDLPKLNNLMVSYLT